MSFRDDDDDDDREEVERKPRSYMPKPVYKMTLWEIYCHLFDKCGPETTTTSNCEKIRAAAKEGRLIWERDGVRGPGFFIPSR